MSPLRRLRQDKFGAAAVEFAVVMPIFLVILLGILVYGLYFSVAHAVQQLTAEAARATVPGLTNAERSSLAQKLVADAIGNYPFLMASKATVNARVDTSDSSRFLVTIRYDATHLGLQAFAPVLPVPPDTIEKTAVIRMGGF